MTMPKDVQEAVDRVNHCELHSFDADWLKIRAHLLSQDAEIDRLIGYVAEADRRVGVQFMAAQAANEESWRRLNSCGEAHRARLAAESRLAAANALLRDTLHQWPSLNCDAFHHKKSDQQGDLDECEPLRRWRALYAGINAHLQGAGDEAAD